MSIRDRFKEFHTNNPHVYYELLSMIEIAKKAGRNKVGMQQLLEVLRWNQSLSTTANDFKLNNDYGAFYTRLIDDMRPDLGALLTRRKSVADYV